MPSFCRHNRFIERCPICSKTLPGNSAGTRTARGERGASRGPSAKQPARRRAPRGEGVRVHHEQRAADDGFRSALVPGLRASDDALRLAEEIAFSSGRLAALAAQPPDLYGEARTMAAEDVERATWTCFLIAYLSPLQGEVPFAGIRRALQASTGEIAELDELPLGPRSSHDRGRGAQTVAAYCKWAEQAGGQSAAFSGDATWGPERRFARLFERLAVGSFARAGRYELLVILGRLGLYELRADSLQLTGGRGASLAEDHTILAAKRVFGIGDPLLLERRAAALAQAAAVPIEALDLALYNWGADERATLGFPEQTGDEAALERAGEALGL